MQRNVSKRSGKLSVMPYSFTSAKVFQSKLFLNIVNIAYRLLDSEISPAIVVAELSIFGHRVMDEAFHKECVDIFGIQPVSKKLKGLLAVIKVTYLLKFLLTVI